MRTWKTLSIVAILLLGTTIGPSWADVQEITPGTGLQGAIVVDTGANGICESAAAPDDLQATPLGQATPFEKEVRCGANKLVETTAAGDDTQVLAVGATCPNANATVVDTGPDGVANTTAAGDDVQLITVGTAPANTPCVLAGANATANTAAAGDDVQVLAVGAVQVNTAVVLCGPNGIADTTANNVIPSGDDVQLLAVGVACSKNAPVVDSGADGISATRAEGSDLVLKVLKPVTVKIPKGQATGSKTVKIAVTNAEFGAAAPASRTYMLDVSNGSCPAGTVSQVDADLVTPGLQTTVAIAKGGKLKGTFVVTMHLEDVTTAAKTTPFRCAVDVQADVVDPALTNDPDDAANPENNVSAVDLEVIDNNDLP